MALDGLDTERPVVRYVGADGAAREIACDFVALAAMATTG